MKKKIETLRREGRLQNQPEFEQLHAELLTAEQAFDKHDKLKAEAKKNYQEARERGHFQIDYLFGLETEFLKAKHLHKFHETELDFRRFRLKRWLSKFLSQSEVPQSTERFIKMVKSARKKVEKAAKEKSAKPEKAAEKPAKTKVEKAKKPEKQNAEKPSEPAKTITKNTKGLANASTKSENGDTARRDDLKRIEGIGEKIEQLLLGSNIFTFKQLAKTSPGKIREILASGGKRFAIANPDSWPKQAELAAAGKWGELDVLQKELKAGKAVVS